MEWKCSISYSASTDCGIGLLFGSLEESGACSSIRLALVVILNRVLPISLQ